MGSTDIGAFLANPVQAGLNALGSGYERTLELGQDVLGDVSGADAQRDALRAEQKRQADEAARLAQEAEDLKLLAATEAEQERLRLAAQQGAASTLLTGPSGLLGEPTTASSYLLGA